MSDLTLTLIIGGAAMMVISGIRWLLVLAHRVTILEQQQRDTEMAVRKLATPPRPLHAISCPRSGPRPVGSDAACTCGLDQ